MYGTPNDQIILTYLITVNICEARLEEDPDPTYGAMSKAATAALAWPVLHQGMSTHCRRQCGAIKLSSNYYDFCHACWFESCTKQTKMQI